MRSPLGSGNTQHRKPSLRHRRLALPAARQRKRLELKIPARASFDWLAREQHNAAEHMDFVVVEAKRANHNKVPIQLQQKPLRWSTAPCLSNDAIGAGGSQSLKKNGDHAMLTGKVSGLTIPKAVASSYPAMGAMMSSCITALSKVRGSRP
jgi:hypothetical protein